LGSNHFNFVDIEFVFTEDRSFPIPLTSKPFAVDGDECGQGSTMK
jgi:hypothetical protein